MVDLPREEDGAIEFWSIKDILRNEFCAISTSVWWKSGRALWQKEEASRKDFKIVLIHHGQEIIYLRALQGQTGRNPIDPSLQDNVLIPNDFFEYIFQIGCAINLHSIINSGLIPGGQNLSKRQTVFFTSVDPMNKEQKDPDVIHLECTASCLVQARSVEETSQRGVLGRHKTWLAQKKGFKFYQTRSNAIILYDTLPRLIVSRKLFGLENWRSHIRGSMWITSTASEDFFFFKKNWMK